MRSTSTTIAAAAAALTSTFAPALAWEPPYPQWPMPAYAPLIPNARRGLPTASEFGLFLSLWAESPAWFNVNPGQVPFHQEIALVPAGTTWLYPRQGPHIIETFPGGKEAFYTAFLAQLRTYITSQITFPDYRELLILDYEWFCPWWTGHFNFTSPEGPQYLDWDPIDDWRYTLRITRANVVRAMTPEQQEAYFKQEWLSTTREFFERTIAAARTACPNAKLGIYNMPSQIYWNWRTPEGALAQMQGHDEVPWFWDLVDVIVPSIYPFYKSVPDDQPVQNGTGYDHESDFDDYIRNNLREALRVAHGKPVFPYVSFAYHSSNVAFANQPCNEFNLRRPLEIAREMGCDGAVVWGWFRTQQEYDLQAPYFNNVVVPFLQQFSTLPAIEPPPQPCAADLGSQGGRAGNDGVLDQNDMVAFIDHFFSRDFLADVGRQGGLPGPDGQLDSNDFVIFIDSFMSGCP